jgi:dihydrolipoamide dehydrogenase
MSKQFDVVVIGAGPGGYIAAIRAAQLGFPVACVDAGQRKGGGAGRHLHQRGLHPVEALLQSSEHFEHAGHAFKGTASTSPACR